MFDTFCPSEKSVYKLTMESKEKKLFMTNNFNENLKRSPIYDILNIILLYQ